MSDIKSYGSIYGEDKGIGYAGNVWDDKKLSPTLNTAQGGNRQQLIAMKVQGSGQINPTAYRIRKLTPRECWRLMGFTDAEFEKAEKVNSNTNLYKQAGNSIVVDVLVAIFKNLFEKQTKEKDEQYTIFDYLEGGNKNGTSCS